MGQQQIEAPAPLHFEFTFDTIDKAREVLARATVFRARVGTRPAFPTQAEAQAFESGWHAYHSGLECPAATPWSYGWLEAERSNDDAADMRDAELTTKGEAL